MEMLSVFVFSSLSVLVEGWQLEALVSSYAEQPRW